MNWVCDMYTTYASDWQSSSTFAHSAATSIAESESIDIGIKTLTYEPWPEQAVQT